MNIRPGPGRFPEPIPRFEDERFITGRGRFVADLAPPGSLVAWFVRSVFASGRIEGIDVSAAIEMPGVVAVYTAADLSLNDLPAAMPDGRPGMDLPMLAGDRVTHVGQPLAVVIAESSALAEDAATMVFADVEPSDPVVTFADALRDESLVHPEVGTNVIVHDQFVAGPELPEGLVDVTVTVEHPRLAPSPIEALAAFAIPDGGRLHLQVGVQAAHNLQQQLSQVMDLPTSDLRVSVPDVGGAFGMKRFSPEYAVVAKAALLLERPIVWVQSRREIFLGGTHGRGQRHEVTLSATPEGRILGAKFRLLTDSGAYPHRARMIQLFSRLVATGLYEIPRVEFEMLLALTNLPPTAPYRGAGRPEAALAIERAVDAMARRLRIDPAELRRRNFVKNLPHETPTGAHYDSGDYAAALGRALQLIDYPEVRRQQEERRRTGAMPLGVGIGAFVERAGGTPDSWEYGEVAIEESGTVVARTGSTSTGQGHETMWRRVVAEVFDVAPATVQLYAGDTAEVADSTGSFASRSVQIGASAIWRCAERVRVAAVEVVAEMLEASPDDIEVAAGAFHVAGVPDQRVTLAEVAARAAATEVELRSEEHYSPGVQTFPYGVHIAVVEVDVDTGVVTPQSLVAVDDVGHVLDEMLVGGQVHGSVMQGVGAALFEEMHYGDDGQPRAATFVDYLMPNAMQMSPLTTDHLSHPAPSNPLGTKGAGEGGCIGMPPAILNATLDALAPWGVTELQIPLAPHKVWAAIQQAANVSGQLG